MKLNQKLNNVEMTVRAANAANNADCTTRRDLREKIVSLEMLRYRNCGRKSLEELSVVAGLPRDYLFKRKHPIKVRCPKCLHGFEYDRTEKH